MLSKGLMTMNSRKPTADYVRQEAQCLTEEQVHAVLGGRDAMMSQVAASRGRLTKHLLKIELLSGFLADSLAGEYTSVTSSELQLAAFPLHYLVRGEDLIPDRVPVAGFSDDIEVILIVWELMEIRLRDYAKWRGLHLDRYFGPSTRD
jgi:uncharacterized membrane protein YkvA (DUF1232 family)